jgi:hypothetical protein
LRKRLVLFRYVWQPVGVRRDGSLFTSTGCAPWTVPAGVSRLTIAATGSTGQRANFPAAAGTGDVVSGSLAGLSPGQLLDVCVDQGRGAAGSPGTGSGARTSAAGADRRRGGGVGFSTWWWWRRL